MAIPFAVLPAGEEPAADADAPSEKDVVAALRKAADEHPGEPDYLFVLGEATLRYGRPAEAAGWLAQAVAMNPADASVQSALGRALLAWGRFEEAVHTLREAVRLDPGSLVPRAALGVALLQSGDAPQASKTLALLAAEFPGQAPLHSNLGTALWQEGRSEEALLSFKRAVSLDHSSADLRRNLGLALSARGDASGAVAAFRHAVRLRPKAALHRLDLADALVDDGQTLEAAAIYDEALALDPGCLLGRPGSQERRHALTLSDIRGEIRSRGGRAFSRTLPVFLLRAGSALVRIAGRRKGLDLAVVLGVLALAVPLTLTLLRPWVRHHLLHDEAVRIARLPVSEDEPVRALLHAAIRKHGLDPWLDADRCQVQSVAALRSIACEYELPVELLPGLRRTLHFRLMVKEPFLVVKAPVLF